MSYLHRLHIVTFQNLSHLFQGGFLILSFVGFWKTYCKYTKKSSNDSSIVDFFYAHVMQYFLNFSWQRASSCWAYLQITLCLDENTLRINGFYILLINRVLCSFVDSWLSCFMRFVDKSIALNGQYACFSGPTACRLKAKVKPLIRLRHAFDGK